MKCFIILTVIIIPAIASYSDLVSSESSSIYGTSYARAGYSGSPLLSPYDSGYSNYYSPLSSYGYSGIGYGSAYRPYYGGYGSYSNGYYNRPYYNSYMNYNSLPYSGYSGLSGYSGQLGSFGYSGQLGSIGYSGQLGLSGYSGQSGYGNNCYGLYQPGCYSSYSSNYRK